ncbi:hypothetical protein Ocin01_05205 [Orchesella cincta]|uniref:Transposase domain-containing protein n=1 Tax=Orchesella cincta TaxID=48709 RepID=A0A1D2N8C6_ORCCI|nr:hypothetical protein Ocin01_05205 [Orchesella cincta]
MEPLNISNLLTLSISTDGIPICKSTGLGMWPILMKVDQVRAAGPYLCALFSGETKPSSISEFMKPFLDELTNLESVGIEFGGVHYSVRVSSVIADAPARSFLKAIKGHTGYHSCERCIDDGEWCSNRVVLSTTSASKRTDGAFRNMIDFDHHTNVSPLNVLRIDMVSQFVLDYMHLVCLGVTKKLLLSWLAGPLGVRLPSRSVKKISEYLFNCKKFFPNDFSRKPRSLKDVHRFKATEFRQFLLYTGVTALHGILDEERYKHFLLFHCGLKILLTDKASVKEWNYLARLLLEKFVGLIPKLYGNQFLVYNVHNLLHLADDGTNFGNLENVSAFPFENFMQILKRMIRGQRLQLEQVVKRVKEQV